MTKMSIFFIYILLNSMIKKCVILAMFSWTIWTFSWKQFIIY